MAAADGAESVGVHYRRTGHQDFYTGGSGSQLRCSVCDALVHVNPPATAQSTATKGWGADRASVVGVDSFNPAPPVGVAEPIDAEHPPANFDG
jgi:hypothetical protein